MSYSPCIWKCTLADESILLVCGEYYFMLKEYNKYYNNKYATSIHFTNIEIYLRDKYGWQIKSNTSYNLLYNAHIEERKKILMSQTPVADIKKHMGTDAFQRAIGNNFHFQIFRECKSPTKSGISDGCTCKVCNVFYPYAITNQDDGTLVCWSCRNMS